MSAIIKTPKNVKEIKKEWLEHQIKRNPHFLSRREFLNRSAAGVTALTFMPAIFSLMTHSQKAQAAQGFSAGAAILSLPGGFSLSPEVVPTDVNGNFLSSGSYRNLGLPNQNLTTGVSMEYGAPLYKASRLYQMLESIKPTITANGGKIYVAAGWHSNSRDDFPTNPTIPAPHILEAAKASGSNFRVLGTQLGSNTDAGGRGISSTNTSGPKPAVATTFAQFKDILSVKKGALAQMSVNSLVAGAALARKLTMGAMDRFAAMNSGRQLAETTQSANAELITNVANNNTADPRLDPIVNNVFGITATTPDNDPKLPLAASVKLLVDGISPVLVAELQRNFDYHDGTANWNAANGAHALVMDTLRAILLTAAQKKKTIGILKQTDGATSFQDGSQIAAGDFSPIHGAGYIFLCMNGEKPPTQFSLGGFVSNDSAGGTANTDITKNILQKHPSFEAHAFVASLLGMQGLKVEDYSPSNISIEEFKLLNLFRG